MASTDGVYHTRAITLLLTGALLASYVCGNVLAASQTGEEADGLDPLELRPEQTINSAQYDVILIVTDSLDNLVGELAPIGEVLRRYQRMDKSLGARPTLVLNDDIPTGCVIYAKTGPLDRDIVDDVRRYEDTAASGIMRVVSTSKKRPLLVIPRTESKQYDTDILVAVLGVLQRMYVPLELRGVGKGKSLEYLGVWGAEVGTLKHTLQLARTLEKARILTRDICASGPERMTAPKIEAYLRKVFNSTKDISMEVISDVNVFKKEYPLLAAVNRAANTVERHQGRLVYMEYTGRGKTNRTLFMVGKGITMDTGGANLKLGNSMVTMHRDKCGAATVAGFMKVLSILKPPNLKVVGAMPLVRNSIGEEAYVADEILTARSGARVRVVNTDAEGRMIMADVLCRMKELATKAVNPHLFTIATLTGHAVRTVGDHYTVVMDNGPARALGTAQRLMQVGDQFADPLEVSRLRREDFKAHKGKSIYEDLVNNVGKPSTLTNRGHQNPMAFLMQVSGLHPYSSTAKAETELPYTHFDIAGPAMTSGPPQCSTLITLVADLVLSDEDKALLDRGTKEEGELRRAQRKKEEEEKERKRKQRRYHDFFFGR